jgi:small subunit ribosomal protein S15
MITGEKKQSIIADMQRSKTDTGSPEVQVAILTRRITEITEHLKTNKKDFMARRGLLQMVGQRRRLLRFIAKHDEQKYLDLLQTLNLRK